MSKNYVIINGELRHWGILGMKWGKRKKVQPGIIPKGYKPKTYDDPKEKDLPGIIPKGYKPKTYDDPNNDKTIRPNVKNDEQLEEVGGEKGSTGPETDNKSNNKTDNKTNNETSSTTTTSDKKQDNRDLAKGATAAKNTGNELKKVASEIDNIKVNRPRMDLSDKSIIQLRTEIAREKAEREYNDLFGKPSKKERAKQKLSNFLQAAGTMLAIGSSALVVANEYKKLKGK